MKVRSARLYPMTSQLHQRYMTQVWKCSDILPAQAFFFTADRRIAVTDLTDGPSTDL